jgi:hypothetical protein
MKRLRPARSVASTTVALFDRIPARVRAVVSYAFGQKKFVCPEMARGGDIRVGLAVSLAGPLAPMG